jgi:putative DNA primase/helicase
MNAWQRRADELAKWAARMVNRTDAWGAYWQDSETKAVKTYTGKPTEYQQSLDHERLRRHFSTDSPREIVGIHALGVDSCGRWAAVDLDIHDDDPNAPTPDQTRAFAVAIYQRVYDLGRGARSVLTSSNGKGGYHLRVLFREAVTGELLFRYARWMVHDYQRFGFDKRPETFPKQPIIPEGGYGNWLRLIGRHPKREYYPEGYNGQQWLMGEGLIDHLLRVPFVGMERIPKQAIEDGPEASKVSGFQASAAGSALALDWQTWDRQTAWDTLLASHGWTRRGRSGDVTYWSRPGKDEGISASLGFKTVDGVQLFYVWSTSTALKPNRYYTPSQYLAFWNYGGNFRECNAAIRQGARHL